MQNFVIHILNAAVLLHRYEYTMGRAKFKTSNNFSQLKR
jgi:hypothetical protein